MSDTMTEPLTTSAAAAVSTRLGAHWRELTLGVLAVALLAVAAWRGSTWWHLEQQQSDRASAISVASAEVTGLTSLSAGSSEADIDALLARATAGFKSDLGKQSETLKNGLTKNHVTANSSVVSAGITSYGDDRATVIVAAAGTVKNRSTTQAQPRNYRVQVSLQKTGGTWLVSGLELVS
ncbi:hypothetical protein GCM10028801_07410 [Nocardioides maradonensis]